MAFLQNEIQDEHIPGAVVHVSHQGSVLMQEAMGDRAVFPERKPMQMDTVFDIASLTKVVATLPAVLLLLEEGKVRLDDPVQLFLPDFQHRVTLRHLLTHTSGLPAHRPYYREDSDVMDRICQEPLQADVGEQVIYSDLNFITLRYVVEAVSLQPFDRFVQKEIFEKLGMNETMFVPTFPEERYAATEFVEHLGDYKRGIVHDENAEFMGGVSGHAGLFSTIHDLAKYARMVELGGEPILSKASMKLARAQHTSEKEPRGLGWVLKGAGDLFSSHTYGHTGFTGTSMWFDPEEELHVILLTNRVHFGRTDAIIRLRSRLHNLIRACV